MSVTYWDDLESLFAQARAMPPERQRTFLEEACGTHPELRAELEALLANHEHACAFFDSLAEAVLPSALHAMYQERPHESPMSSASDPFGLCGQTVSHYRVTEGLGGGGMGFVYKAQDTKLDRAVALKFLPPHLSANKEAKRRFMQEAKAASALDHANICTIHEIAETEQGQLFIAMACYEGETLRQKIERGPLPRDEAYSYAVQIAEGLSCAHKAGIVHRDIKPANVMVTPEGIAKILDFGLAKVQDVTLTQTGATLGTVAYMSPEQARGEQVDQRTDIWSFGVVLYEMLTGVRPFDGLYHHAILYAVLNEEPAPITQVNPALPEALERIVHTCLQKEPTERYPQAKRVLDDLQQLRDGTPPAASRRALPVSATRLMPRLPVSRRSLTSLGAAGLILLLLLGWFARDRVPEARHLAVLPFQVIGEVADAEAFSAGLLETLTSRLTQLEQFQGSLWVVPASEIVGPMTPSDAHEQLGVTIVVTGTIQIEAGLTRLTLNLIDASTRRQIGSEQIDQRRSGALALQDEAVLMLARMLQIKLNPQGRQALTAGGTTAPRANDFYLRGRGYLRQHQSLQDLEIAISLFETAVAEDPAFALAYAGLGEAYWQKYRLTDDVQWVDEAIQHSQQALALNDRLAPVYVTLGIIHSGRQQYEAALQAYEQALAIDPVNADAYRRQASVFRRQGRFVEAEQAYRQAIALQPDYWRGYNSLAVLYYSMGHYEDAIAQYKHGLQLAPANQTLLLNLGATYWELERLNEAMHMFERVLQIDPSDASARSNLATAYFYQGRFQDAARLYEEELAVRPHDYSVQGYLADTYYWIPGRRHEALQAYRKAAAMAREHLAVSAQKPDLLGSLASYYARLGVRDSARVFLQQVESMLRPEQADVVMAFGLGEVYEQLHDREQALLWMTSALDRGYGWIQIRHSPWLNDLRSDPAFQQMSLRYHKQEAP